MKKIVKFKDKTLNENDTLKIKKEEITKLNKEFEDIKKLLIKYLRENVLEKFDFEKFVSEKDFLEMYTIFKPNSSLNNNEWNEKEFKSTSDYKHIKEIYAKERKDNLIYCESYIVNFNYTNSPWLYHLKTYSSFSDLNTDINSIHGEVDTKGFEPVFGFGDEMDKDYESIENIDDNEYLRFFKSFQYFQNTCYDSILKFIDSEKFQICILGHSCGLSDRVMLNTIFEHKNCCSIKIYYHQKDNNTDNYLDIVKNISRHFKNKSSMRRKIVSKEISTPLTQNVRFKEK